MNKKQTLIAYLTVISIGLVMTIVVCNSKNILNQSTEGVMRILSDAFLLPAVMFCGLGGLTFVSNSGSFNMIVYGTKSFFCRIFKRNEFLERYADYYEYNKKMQKEKAPFGFILLPGIVFLILAVFFTVMYSNI